MFSSRFLVPAVALLFVLACDSNPRLLVTAPEEAAFNRAGGGGQPDESASGSGHATYVQEKRTFTFTARNRADGTVSGQFQIINRDLDIRTHGSILCMTVKGNEAWIAGLVEITDRENLAPATTWRVVDNGQGAAASPDQISFAYPSSIAIAEGWCRDTPRWTLVPVEQGNIQVRP
jgi:hypothetical protein